MTSRTYTVEANLTQGLDSKDFVVKNDFYCKLITILLARATAVNWSIYGKKHDTCPWFETGDSKWRSTRRPWDDPVEVEARRARSHHMEGEQNWNRKRKTANTWSLPTCFFCCWGVYSLSIEPFLTSLKDDCLIPIHQYWIRSECHLVVYPHSAMVISHEVVNTTYPLITFPFCIHLVMCVGI